MKKFTFGKKSKGQKPLIVLKHELNSLLHAFGQKLKRSPDKRRHFYGVVPIPDFSDLIPIISFKTIDPTRFSDESVRESLLYQEKLYEKFKVIDISVSDGRRGGTTVRSTSASARPSKIPRSSKPASKLERALAADGRRKRKAQEGDGGHLSNSRTAPGADGGSHGTGKKVPLIFITLY